MIPAWMDPFNSFSSLSTAFPEGRKGKVDLLCSAVLSSLPGARFPLETLEMGSQQLGIVEDAVRVEWDHF